jgi:L-alanine-DL-glutamate epimerase-like enolase superfamily enzyme
MEVAAGEYGYDPFYFRRMLQADAVDVLQADATRCGGYTGFLRAAALADAPRNGFIEPDLGRPGHGLAFKEKDAMHLAA